MKKVKVEVHNVGGEHPYHIGLPKQKPWAQVDEPGYAHRLAAMFQEEEDKHEGEQH